MGRIAFTDLRAKAGNLHRRNHSNSKASDGSPLARVTVHLRSRRMTLTRDVLRITLQKWPGGKIRARRTFSMELTLEMLVCSYREIWCG